jgi:hypothetical protein
MFFVLYLKPRSKDVRSIIFSSAEATHLDPSSPMLFELFIKLK